MKVMFYKVVHRELGNSTSYRSAQTDLILPRYGLKTKKYGQNLDRPVSPYRKIEWKNFLQCFNSFFMSVNLK
jgi:hypothetical protein